MIKITKIILSQKNQKDSNKFEKNWKLKMRVFQHIYLVLKDINYFLIKKVFFQNINLFKLKNIKKS